MPKRVYIKRRPKYYLRQLINGRWMLLWRINYKHTSTPIWWPEDEIGESKPLLYKTLTGANHALDLFGSTIATKTEIAIWMNVDAVVQT